MAIATVTPQRHEVAQVAMVETNCLRNVLPGDDLNVERLSPRAVHYRRPGVRHGRDYPQRDAGQSGRRAFSRSSRRCMRIWLKTTRAMVDKHQVELNGLLGSFVEPRSPSMRSSWPTGRRSEPMSGR